MHTSRRRDLAARRRPGVTAWRALSASSLLQRVLETTPPDVIASRPRDPSIPSRPSIASSPPPHSRTSADAGLRRIGTYSWQSASNGRHAGIGVNSSPRPDPGGDFATASALRHPTTSCGQVWPRVSWTILVCNI